MNNMKKIAVSMALMALIGAPTAIAQTGAGSGASKSGDLPPAPVGHRQPRADRDEGPVPRARIAVRRGTKGSGQPGSRSISFYQEQKVYGAGADAERTIP